MTDSVHGGTPETLDERIARLEEIAFEGDGLTRAVSRLGLNAEALAQAVLQVDRQQQTLTRLGRDLSAVQESSVSKEDLARKEAERVERERRERRRRGQRVVMWLVIGGAVVAMVALASVTRQAEREADQAAFQREVAHFRQAVLKVCEDGNQQARSLATLAEASRLRIRNDPKLTPAERATALANVDAFVAAFPVVDCEGLHS